MDARILLFLIVLGTCWCCNARVVNTNLSPIQDAIAAELQINDLQHEMEDESACIFCEVVLTPIIQSLANTTTQTGIMSFLHLICAFTSIAQEECNAIVNHYVPQIFSQASTSTPKEICQQVGLCESTNVSRHLSENSCQSCHLAVTEASLKLNNPDYQLHIVELLLKACNAMEDSVNNHCKGLVLANALLIPVYAKQMLDGHAICNLLYDCSSPTNAAERTSSSGTYLHPA